MKSHGFSLMFRVINLQLTGMVLKFQKKIILQLL